MCVRALPVTVSLAPVFSAILFGRQLISFGRAVVCRVCAVDGFVTMEERAILDPVARTLRLQTINRDLRHFLVTRDVRLYAPDPADPRRCTFTQLGRVQATGTFASPLLFEATVSASRRLPRI